MLAFVLMLVALIVAILAIANVQTRWNLIALALAFMAASFCVQLYP